MYSQIDIQWKNELGKIRTNRPKWDIIPKTGYSDANVYSAKMEISGVLRMWQKSIVIDKMKQLFCTLTV